MDRVSQLWRLRRRARRGALCMALFCMTMAVLYTLCAENSVPVTDAIFGERARTRAQPRAHSLVKVCMSKENASAGVAVSVYRYHTNYKW